ncbi:FAD-dependent thymidylate synthase [Alterisphingorhabdus coralli]|uniref:FAD-dependent thymidylate synthase n=1 Tax=Alterisphingorhabdus coralli TaxID=3071408 RepID=A0AA97I145_9SPHN|nr:FAD-dependent thymidylate synthase [Parasphingorhabdus sp. SCSIO 66989]WOE76354.1 FAD-dependent thymidylate synthase [Parasphingorhabdus sp. SCSIO 66989]
MIPAQLVHCSDEDHILYIARVSSNQENTDPGLISWLIKQGHWSPFEMVGACIEVNTTRDIGRQILRHRSFSFQEFSQRYATVSAHQSAPHREMRLKGSKSNRQGSGGERDQMLEVTMAEAVIRAFQNYDRLIHAGVAPECARSILPEGYTPTRMYMNGTLRSWIHYLAERLRLNPKDNRPWAQLEHYRIAAAIYALLKLQFPVTFEAIEHIAYIDKPRRQMGDQAGEAS